MNVYIFSLGCLCAGSTIMIVYEHRVILSKKLFRVVGFGFLCLNEKCFSKFVLHSGHLWAQTWVLYGRGFLFLQQVNVSRTRVVHYISVYWSCQTFFYPFFLVDSLGCQHTSSPLGNGAIVETSDGKILVLQRSYNVGEFPGYFVFPGGHSEVTLYCISLQKYG